MIRIIITGGVATVFLAISAIIIIPMLYIVGWFSREKRDHMTYAIVQWALGVVVFLSGAKVDMKGLENIPKNQPVLYVGNHRSIFDIIISYSVIPPLTGFVSKIEMKKFPILSWYMNLMNCLFLDRDNPREGLKTILAAIDMINSGKSVFIFPEGTRSKSDDGMLEFKEGSLKIAQKTNCPIIPVAFNNTSAIFEDQLPKLKKAKVSVEFGKPIIPSELDDDTRKHLGKYTHDIVKEMVEKNVIR